MASITPLNAHSKQSNQQNKNIKEAVALLPTAVNALIRRNYTILSIEIEHGQPIIWIQACARAHHDLNGVMYVRRGGSRQEQTFQAQLDGCRVQWTVTGSISA